MYPSNLHLVTVVDTTVLSHNEVTSQQNLIDTNKLNKCYDTELTFI